MTTLLGPLPHALRERACGILGHTPAAELNLPGCPLPDADLVEQLLDRVAALEHELRLAHSREERR